MKKIAIIVDSTCDLSPELVKQNNIIIVPLTVNFPDESFHDGVDIDVDTLYKKVQEKGVLPKTAALTLGEAYNIFEKYIDEGYDIIYTGISGTMSKSYENVLMMAKEFPEGRIEVVDSQNLSTGIGLLVLKACEWRDEGKNISEIAALMRETVSKVRSQFVIETMEYLHKGGRCSGIAKLFGSLLKIKPIIEVKEGKMGVAAMPRGKIEIALNKLLEILVKDLDNIVDDKIFITHSKAFESAKYLKEKIEGFDKKLHIFETNAGCVVSTHCGPGTIGILYITK